MRPAGHRWSRASPPAARNLPAHVSYDVRSVASRRSRDAGSAARSSASESEVTSMRSRLLWTDGHSDTRDIDSSAGEMTIVGEDGRPHGFRASPGQDADGSTVWVEESR